MDLLLKLLEVLIGFYVVGAGITIVVSLIFVGFIVYAARRVARAG